jgi:hypothetical protein
MLCFSPFSIYSIAGARIQSFGDALKITAPAASVNRALHTTIYAWQHKKTGTFFLLSLNKY